MKRLTARWVLPISAPPIEHGVVAIGNDGRIVYVGGREAAPEAGEEDLGNAILLPGLVNAHSHIDLTVLRGRIREPSFFDWIRRLVETKRLLDDESLFASSCVGIAEGIRAGITTFADTSDSEAPMHALLRMGARGISYQEVFGPDPDQCHDAMEGLRARVERLRANESALVSVGVSPHAPYTVSDPLYRAVAGFAAAAKLPVAAHIAESLQEEDYVAAASGPFAELLAARGIGGRPRATTPLELLERTGLLELRPLLIHCNRLSDVDVARIAQSSSSVVHCPISNARLGHAVSPVGALLQAGVPVAIGSDSVVANDRMDLLEEARSAALIQRIASGGDLDLPARQLAEMLTLGGARALGLGHLIGSLEPGKYADLVAFSLDSLSATPCQDPFECLVFSLRGSDAVLVMVAGGVVWRDGRHTAEISRELRLVRETAGTLC